MNGNPLLKRAKAYRLTLRCRCCEREFAPAIAEVDDRLIVTGCCPRCRPAALAINPRPGPTVRARVFAAPRVERSA